MITQKRLLSILEKAQSLLSKPKHVYQIGWKRVISVIVIVGVMTGGFSGTAQGATPAADQGLYEGAAIVPRVEQSGSIATNNKYLSTYVERDRSSEQPSMLSPMMAAAVTRCPAFVSWEDWGGSRVHAYVDFHPSDVCNGKHVKKAYVRLIRQCGPYYDTGRIYTYTAGSPDDTALYSVSAWIFDSALWGCVTNTYYGYEYF